MAVKLEGAPKKIIITGISARIRNKNSCQSQYVCVWFCKQSTKYANLQDAVRAVHWSGATNSIIL